METDAGGLFCVIGREPQFALLDELLRLLNRFVTLSNLLFEPSKVFFHCMPWWGRFAHVRRGAFGKRPPIKTRQAEVWRIIEHRPGKAPRREGRSVSTMFSLERRGTSCNQISAGCHCRTEKNERHDNVTRLLVLSHSSDELSIDVSGPCATDAFAFSTALSRTVHGQLAQLALEPKVAAGLCDLRFDVRNRRFLTRAEAVSMRSQHVIASKRYYLSDNCIHRAWSSDALVGIAQRTRRTDEYHDHAHVRPLREMIARRKTLPHVSRSWSRANSRPPRSSEVVVDNIDGIDGEIKSMKTLPPEPPPRKIGLSSELPAHSTR